MKKHGVTFTVVRAMAYQLHNQAHFLFQLIGEEQHSLAHMQEEAASTHLAKKLDQPPTRVESAPASDATIPADWLAQQAAGNPPAHWLQRVQQGAPTLLTGTGPHSLSTVPRPLEPATSSQAALVAPTHSLKSLTSDQATRIAQKSLSEQPTSSQLAFVAPISPTEPLTIDQSAFFAQVHSSEQPTSYQLVSIAQASPTEPLTSQLPARISPEKSTRRGKQPSAIRRVLAPFWPTRQRHTAERTPSEQAQTRAQPQLMTHVQPPSASQTEATQYSAASSEHAQAVEHTAEQATLTAQQTMQAAPQRTDHHRTAGQPVHHDSTEASTELGSWSSTLPAMQVANQRDAAWPMQPTMPAIPVIARTHPVSIERAWNVDASHKASHVAHPALANVPADVQTNPWPSLPSSTTLSSVVIRERATPSHEVQATPRMRTHSEEPSKQTTWPLISQVQAAQPEASLVYGSEQWPELPDESPTISQDWRSIQQAWQHQQRLDDEQRGNLWNA